MEPEAPELFFSETFLMDAFSSCYFLSVSVSAYPRMRGQKCRGVFWINSLDAHDDGEGRHELSLWDDIMKETRVWTCGGVVAVFVNSLKQVQNNYCHLTAQMRAYKGLLQCFHDPLFLNAIKLKLGAIILPFI